MNHARLALGRRELPLAEVKPLVGWGVDRLIAGAFPDEADRVPARELYLAHHQGTCLAATTLLPGVGATLHDLAERGFVLGVATNKYTRFARALLDGLGVGGELAAVLGADQVSEPKPHPELLERALAALGLDASEALYVGDMHVDVRTGHAAGVRVIGVTTGGETAADLARAGADRVIGQLGELPALVGWPSAKLPARSLRGEIDVIE